MNVRRQTNYRAQEGEREKVISIFFFIYLHSMLTCALCFCIYASMRAHEYSRQIAE